MIGKLPAVLNFNRLFLKLSRFMCTNCRFLLDHRVCDRSRKRRNKNTLYKFLRSALKSLSPPFLGMWPPQLQHDLASSLGCIAFKVANLMHKFSGKNLTIQRSNLSFTEAGEALELSIQLEVCKGCTSAGETTTVSMWIAAILFCAGWHRPHNSDDVRCEYSLKLGSSSSLFSTSSACNMRRSLLKSVSRFESDTERF